MPEEREKSLVASRALEVSVVISAYNEEVVMDKTIQRVTQCLEADFPRAWELILVNDGSQDRTGEIMDQAAVSQPRIQVIHHRRNYGQGRGLRNGFSRCRGKVVVTLDADLSYGPQYITRLYRALEENQADIALASPYVKGGRVQNVPLYRYLISRMGNRYLASMSPYEISTSSCVVRAYRREVLDSLFLSADGMDLQLEVLAKAWLFNFKVCEIPATLAWPDKPRRGQRRVRRSKMRLWQTATQYLRMGWLLRPAYFMLWLSAFLLLPGLYMAFWLGIRVVQSTVSFLEAGESINWAFSHGLQEVFQVFSYSFVLGGTLIIVGLLIMLIALLVIQHKLYHDELLRLGQEILYRLPRRTDSKP